MSQALKIIQFETEENTENREVIGEASSKIYSNISTPLKYAATITAVLGVISLVLEIKLYFQFSYGLYLSRLFPTVLSFFTLIVVDTKFGKKHNNMLAHIYLLSIIASISFFVFKVPSLFVYNVLGALLLTLVLSLFIVWQLRNQFFVVIYFSVFISISSYFSGILKTNNFDIWVIVFAGGALLGVSVLASYLKLSAHLEGFSKFKKIFKDLNDENKEENNEIERSEFISRLIIPFFQLSLNGKLNYANPAFLEILSNPTEKELKNYNFFSNLIKNDNVKTHILKKIESKGRIENYRLNITEKDGTQKIYILDCRADSIDSKNVNLEGTLKNVTHYFSKETELLKELESLKLLKKNSPTIIPNISGNTVKKPNIVSKLGHELRTPMNSVLGFLTLIENGLFESEDELKDFSRSAKLSAESLLNLLNDIVELSKIEDGTVDFVESEFNISSEIENVVSGVDRLAKEKNLNIVFNISEDVPEKIISDQFKYNQILTNLLTNSINATEEGEIRLLVSKRNKNHQIEIITSIEDSSAGYNQTQLNELLNIDSPNKDTKAKITISKLQIMICKELLSLLEGDLSVTSEPGKGSKYTFSLFYPDINYGVANLEEAKKQTGKFGVVSKSRSKLLLVEDNPISQKVEKKLLEDAGYNVDCVDNGLEAIEKIKNGSYDLVLMDIELKELDGLETTKIIRELQAPLNDIPIVAVTAQSSMKDREKCLLAGMNDYISKPININFLKMTIDQWLNEAREK